jgi:hypothetical protein
VAITRPLGPSLGGWYYIKTIWIAPPAFHGPVLVRGRRLDRAGDVRFSHGFRRAGNFRELRLQFERRITDWKEAKGPRYTVVAEPGCFGLQVDGPAFSRTLVFEAKVGS